MVGYIVFHKEPKKDGDVTADDRINGVLRVGGRGRGSTMLKVHTDDGFKGGSAVGTCAYLDARPLCWAVDVIDYAVAVSTLHSEFWGKN